MFMCGFSYIIVAFMEVQLQANHDISIMWQCLAYVVLTISEVMVYGTGLEFSYTQAPNNMKSLIMGFFLLSVSVGSLFTAWINWFIQNEDGSLKLQGAQYFWFFTALMFLTSIGFIFVAKHYKVKTFVRTE